MRGDSSPITLLLLVIGRCILVYALIRGGQIEGHSGERVPHMELWSLSDRQLCAIVIGGESFGHLSVVSLAGGIRLKVVCYKWKGFPGELPLGTCPYEVVFGIRDAIICVSV